MKPIINRLTGIAGYVFFVPANIERKIKAIPAIILIFPALILSSCFQHFFRTDTKLSAEAATIQRLQTSNKYFIIHFGDNKVFGLKNVFLNSNEIEGNLEELSPEHSKYLNPAISKANLVKKEDKKYALLEVHLYTAHSQSDSSHLLLPLTSFNRLDVYTFDEGKTRINHILSVVGVTVGAGTVVAIIAAIGAGGNASGPAPGAGTAGSGCNCPQVYISHNGLYEFKSGVYSGAVYSALERTDYLALPGITAVDNKYQFRIGNVPNEEQFINQVQLMKVEHPADVKVLADRHGKIFTYKNAVSPLSAKYDDTDVAAQLKFIDDQYYSFDSKDNSGGFSSITMQFNKPAGTNKAKLLVHAGNSNWSGYLFKEFVSLFGDKYEKWRLQQELTAPANAEQWQIDQGLPMKVFVQTEKGWQYVDHFALTGNTASRDMIMEIDLTGVERDKVNIRIESTFQFWNLDMAALDFSNNTAVTSFILNPASVVKNNKEDNRGQLLHKDVSYSHLSNRDYISLEYDAPASSDNASFFLISTGYYHTMPQINGKTDLKALLQFKEKGTFDRFSRNKFDSVQKTLAAAEN